MDTGLAGKVVLITGATRNHGRASALAFAQEGAHLLICTRQSMDLLEETAALAAKSDVRVVTDRCDVTDEEQVYALVQKGLKEFAALMWWSTMRGGAPAGRCSTSQASPGRRRLPPTCMPPSSCVKRSCLAWWRIAGVGLSITRVSRAFEARQEPPPRWHARDSPEPSPTPRGSTILPPT